MALAIVLREVGGVAILDLNGRITLGEGSIQLREAIRALLDKGSKKILLNLREVTLIDSSGVGELALALKSARHGSGELKLLNPADKVHELLHLTRLSTVFEIMEDEVSAIASFK